MSLSWRKSFITVISGYVILSLCDGGIPGSVVFTLSTFHCFFGGFASWRCRDVIFASLRRSKQSRTALSVHVQRLCFFGAQSQGEMTATFFVASNLWNGSRGGHVVFVPCSVLGTAVLECKTPSVYWIVAVGQNGLALVCCRGYFVASTQCHGSVKHLQWKWFLEWSQWLCMFGERRLSCSFLVCHFLEESHSQLLEVMTSCLCAMEA